MKRTGIAAITAVLVTLAAGLGGLPSKAVASTDATSPAGTTPGMVVVFSPAFGAAPGPVSGGSPILPPLTGRFAPGLPAPGVPGPVLPGILLLAPTPATGSLVVPLRLSPALGSGLSFTQLQLVIPGPNPAQNTTVGVAQLLNMLLGSAQSAGSTGGPPPVSVFSPP